MNAFLEALATHPRLNFWLGPGCSTGLTSWTDALALRELRRTNPTVDQTVDLEETFSLLDRQTRGQFQHSTFNGMNWTYIALAALAEKDRAGAIVLRNIDGQMPKLLASKDFLPPLFSELDDAAAGGSDESSTLLFDLPVIRDSIRWRDPVHRAGGAHPWVVAGVAKPRPSELAVLKEIAASGAPIYWVPLWTGSAPAGLKANIISGFDPDSFFFSLAQAATGVLPHSLARAANEDPEVALERALQAESKTLRDCKELFLRSAEDDPNDLTSLDDAAFENWLKELHRNRLRMTRLVPGLPNTGGIEMFHDAATVGGRRADRLLEIASDDYRRMPVETTGFRAVLNAAQWVRIQHARAKLRRPAEAEPFYQDAYRSIQSLPPKEPRQWQSAVDFANMLGDWADAKKPAEAERLLREAIDILSRALNGGPLKPFEERPLWNTQITLLRQHALRLDGESGARFFAEARECCEWIKALQDEFMYQYHLGIISFEEARRNPAREVEFAAAGNRHFAAALELSGDRKGVLHFDWGSVIASICRERQGAEADRYFAEGFAHFAKAAKNANAYGSTHNNWAAFLLIQARRKTGPKRENLLSESWKHASACEEREPTKGAYNLACIAAERGDWETMSQWLHISARGPRFPAPAHTDTVTSFDPIRNEAWFRELLGELYP